MFFEGSDYRAHLDWIGEAAQRYHCAIAVACVWPLPASCLSPHYYIHVGHGVCASLYIRIELNSLWANITPTPVSTACLSADGQSRPSALQRCPVAKPLKNYARRYHDRNDAVAKAYDSGAHGLKVIGTPLVCTTPA